MGERLLVTIAEAAEMLAIGRSTMYGVLGDSERTGIRVIKLGKSSRVLVRDLEAYVERLAAESVN